MALAYAMATDRCWVEYESGWTQIDWTSSDCHYRAYEQNKWLILEYASLVPNMVRPVYYRLPWYCATSSSLPVDATTSWTFGSEGYTPCTYWMRRLKGDPSTQPDVIQVTTWTTGIVCDDWCDHQTAWIYLPVTAADQPVVFSFGGLGWRFDRQIFTCECYPQPDPGEGY